MPKKGHNRFKVISTTGIEIYFSTKKFCQQYIKSKGGNKKDGAHKEYSIIEYGKLEKEAGVKDNQT